MAFRCILDMYMMEVGYSHNVHASKQSEDARVFGGFVGVKEDGRDDTTTRIASVSTAKKVLRNRLETGLHLSFVSSRSSSRMCRAKSGTACAFWTMIAKTPAVCLPWRRRWAAAR